MQDSMKIHSQFLWDWVARQCWDIVDIQCWRPVFLEEIWSRRIIWSKKNSVGRAVSHNKKISDGENYLREGSKENQEEDISWVLSEVERTSNGIFKLGHKTWYFEAWTESAGAHGHESMKFFNHRIMM